MVRIHASQITPPALPALIRRLMPVQGSVEVQHDQPGKCHDWHAHPTDETLVVLDGGLRFYWTGGERLCGPGDVIHLPAGARHGSEALAAGVTYLIAPVIVALDPAATA